MAGSVPAQGTHSLLKPYLNPKPQVVVVGNPCNTNAMIAMANAPRLNPRNFSALTRLDENRAKCQLALKACSTARAPLLILLPGR